MESWIKGFEGLAELGNKSVGDRGCPGFLCSLSSFAPQKVLSSMMQDGPVHPQGEKKKRPVPHNHTQAHLVSILAFPDSFLPWAYSLFFMTHSCVAFQVPAASPPRDHWLGGDSDQKSEAGIRLEGCVERERSGPLLFTKPSSLRPQGGVP